MAPGGYAWWYVDALSDDGAHGLTLIGFVGSVFSPYYAHARRHGAGDPLDHCALNVALYGRGGKRWAMTERGRAQVRRDAATLQLGPSALHWDGAALVIDVDELTMPWPSRLRGRIRVQPAAVLAQDYPLDAAGRHRWRPIAPCARVEVALSHPALHWSGSGYLDSNSGDAPLEHAFARWDWARAALPGERAAVLYDVTRTDGSAMTLALQFDAAGRVQAFEPPPPADLPASGWRIARGTRSDGAARVADTLEDGPFYARSLVEARWQGAPVVAVHESLSLQRFGRRWVQALLPFRMPRALGG